MQPATNSARPAEDLHSILNRFQTWAGKQPENPNGHKPNPAGVREIPMEEAIRQLRRRRMLPSAALPEEPGIPQPPVSDLPETKVEAALRANLGKEGRISGLKATEPSGNAPKPHHSARSAKKATLTGEAPSAKAGPTTARASMKALKGAESQRPARKSAAKRAHTAARVAAPKQESGRAEFREVLARKVEVKRPARKEERRQRISVRLSSAEERRLQQRASEAGLTISEYLRRSALEAKAAPAKTEHATARISGRATASPLFAASATPNTSLVGGWLALLRNRFLASPPRLAERA